MIRAISLWQPWASAIAVGSKQFETRSWKPPHCYSGVETIAIHAAKQWKLDEREWTDELRRFGIDVGFESTPPLGALVAVAKLGRFIRTENCPEGFGLEFDPAKTEDELLLGNYEPGRWAWELLDVKPLTEPIPLKGRQGFWILDPDTERLVRNQLEVLEVRS